MHTFRLSLALLLLLPAACAAPDERADEAEPLAAAHARAIVDSVETTLAGYRGAVNALDADAVAAYYLADSTFRWIEDGEIRYRRPSEVAAAIRTFAGSVQRTELLLDGLAITPVAPGVAIVSTGFAQKIEDLEGNVGGFTGAITAVLVHRGDRWLFQVGHTSSAPAADR